MEGINLFRKVAVGDPTRMLSRRELEVMIAISSGKQPAEAAQRAGIGAKTFSTYRSRLLEKLQLGSNAELAILAYELKLVPSVLERYKEQKDERSSVTPDGDA